MECCGVELWIAERLEGALLPFWVSPLLLTDSARLDLVMRVRGQSTTWLEDKYLCIKCY